jgi:hypothetical protein
MGDSIARVQLPRGDIVVSVSLVNPVNFGPAVLSRFMAPAVPGLEKFQSSPSHSFLLEHPSGRRLVFDLGIRKDYQNYAPKIAAYIPTTKYNIEVEKNVVEILEAGGVPAESVEAVIWRCVYVHSLRACRSSRHFNANTKSSVTGIGIISVIRQRSHLLLTLSLVKDSKRPCSLVLLRILTLPSRSLTTCKPANAFYSKSPSSEQTSDL